MSVARIGILTISDRASRGEYEDKGGPAIHAWFTRVLTSPWQAVAKVIPDEQPEIEAALRQLSDVENCCLNRPGRDESRPYTDPQIYSLNPASS